MKRKIPRENWNQGTTSRNKIVCALLRSIDCITHPMVSPRVCRARHYECVTLPLFGLSDSIQGEKCTEIKQNSKTHGSTGSQ